MAQKALVSVKEPPPKKAAVSSNDMTRCQESQPQARWTSYHTCVIGLISGERLQSQTITHALPMVNIKEVLCIFATFKNVLLRYRNSDIGTGHQDGPWRTTFSPRVIFLVAFAPPVGTLN